MHYCVGSCPCAAGGAFWRCKASLSMGFYGENCDLTMENGDFMGLYMHVIVCCCFFLTKMGYHRVIKGIEWDTSSTCECS